MYIFELLTKIIKGKKYYKKDNFDPFKAENLEDYSDCKHIFLPIDSTEEVLACTKCGLMVNQKDLKDENIFKNNLKN